MKRKDDFNARRQHLKDLSEEELFNRFWELTELIVKPLVDIAYKNTSPSIERSVLLRMGFSSIEADNIVKHGIKWELLGYGMGKAVLTLAEYRETSYEEAGKILSRGECWEIVDNLLKGEAI